MKLVRVALATGLALALAGVNKTGAQQMPMISQYMSNQLFINPAYAGTHDYTTLSGLMRKQWTDFPGAPQTGFITMDGRINGSNMGLGFSLVNDRLGITEETTIAGNFAYRIPVAKGHLSFGLKAAVSYYNANLNDLKVWDATDQVYANGVISRWVPNFGAGIYYSTEMFYAGISTPTLIKYTKPSTNMSAEISRVPAYERHYYLSSGYVFKMENDIFLKPSVLVKYVADAPLEADINLNVFFLRRLMLGGGYRTRDGFVAMTELRITPKLRMGYAFDYPMTKLNQYSNGTHEFMLAYDFVRDITKMKTPRFF
jgi:type IX secretion system PorP/SprF family membrane protein